MKKQPEISAYLINLDKHAGQGSPGQPGHYGRWLFGPPLQPGDKSPLRQALREDAVEVAIVVVGTGPAVKNLTGLDARGY